MAKRGRSRPRLRFALLFLLILAACSLIAQQSRSSTQFQEFLRRLNAVYAELEDLQAIVTVFKLTPKGEERAEAQVRIRTLVRQKVLRLEFLEPPELRGQVYTLQGQKLSQYFPVNNLIVVQEITERHALYSLLEFFNLDLERIITRLQEEGYSLTVSQEIIPSGKMLELELELEPELELELNLGTSLSVARLTAGEPTGEILALDLSLTRTYYAPETVDLRLDLMVGDWEMGDYLLEARSQREGLLGKELIWFDPLNLVPRRVEIYLIRRLDGRVREEVTIYYITGVRLNEGLTEEELLALPKDAKIIEAPPE